MKNMLEIAEEVVALLGASLDEEVEAQLRAMNERGSVHLVALAVASLAIGHAIVRGLELSPEVGVALQMAGSIVAKNVKALPADRAAEFTEQEREIARRLGAKIPKIGRA